MTRLNYPLLLLLTAIVLISSCKKDKKKDPVIDDKNLTACPDGLACEYLFTEHADINENGMIKTGAYRLFWSTAQGPGLKSSVFIKAPLNNKSFELTDDDIQSGRVINTVYACPACDYIILKPVGGWVKGINKTPNAQPDKAKWLIEAKIYLQAEGNASLKDTLFLKQYFNANFVID